MLALMVGLMQHLELAVGRLRKTPPLLVETLD
jgi:hypothetical protein